MGLKECKKIYNKITMDKKIPAIEFLKNNLREKEKIRKEIKKNPETWFAPYHFHWGMFIRNLLRNNKFGEKYFEIGNLDDIYVELVEDALKK